MKRMLLFLTFFFVPGPTASAMLKPPAKSGIGLTPTILQNFSDLIAVLPENSPNPQIAGIQKALHDLFEKVVKKDAPVAYLLLQLKTMILKMKDPQFKDQTFASDLYGQITLGQYAEFWDDIIRNINNLTSLSKITPTNIEYFQEIIDALPAGKGAAKQVNDIRVKLLVLLQAAKNNAISLAELITDLKTVAEKIEADPSSTRISFDSTTYGKDDT